LDLSTHTAVKGAGNFEFGACAPAPVLMREYGFTVEHVCKRARALLERNHA
jgi:transketolase